MRGRPSLNLLLALAIFGSFLVLAPSSSAQGGAQSSADRITVDDLKALVADGKPVLILDVRGEIDSKIKGARHIPLNELESRIGEIPPDLEIVTYCA